MGMQAGLQYTFLWQKHTAHADSEMKQSGIELSMAKKRRNAAEAYGARHQRDEAKRNRAEHGVEKEQQK